MQINVQFSDNTEERVVGYFSSPQDPTVWPNMGQIDTSDARWKTYYDAQPDTVKSLIPASD